MENHEVTKTGAFEVEPRVNLNHNKHLWAAYIKDDVVTLTEKVFDLQRQVDELKAKLRKEPEWVVNNLGELGVHVNDRYFFLYKGANLEYDMYVESGVVHNGDGTPMQVRPVGKVEFGEVVKPCTFFKVNAHGQIVDETPKPYTSVTQEFIEGLSEGKPEDYLWKPLPAPKEEK